MLNKFKSRLTVFVVDLDQGTAMLILLYQLLFCLTKKTRPR